PEAIVILDAQDLTCRFGQFTAVDNVSFCLHQDEILGIAGTNGAGKSTLFASVAGQLQLTAGQVTFDGHRVTEMPAYRRAQLGLVRTFQTPREFKSLTVLENLLAAAPNPVGEQLLFSFIRTAALRKN